MLRFKFEVFPEEYAIPPFWYLLLHCMPCEPLQYKQKEGYKAHWKLNSVTYVRSYLSIRKQTNSKKVIILCEDLPNSLIYSEQIYSWYWKPKLTCNVWRTATDWWFLYGQPVFESSTKGWSEMTLWGIKWHFGGFRPNSLKIDMSVHEDIQCTCQSQYQIRKRSIQRWKTYWGKWHRKNVLNMSLLGHFVQQL